MVHVRSCYIKGYTTILWGGDEKPAKAGRLWWGAGGVGHAAHSHARTHTHTHTPHTPTHTHTNTNTHTQTLSLSLYRQVGWTMREGLVSFERVLPDPSQYPDPGSA